jgi:hypothetical protein
MFIVDRTSALFATLRDNPDRVRILKLLKTSESKMHDKNKNSSVIFRASTGLVSGSISLCDFLYYSIYISSQAERKSETDRTDPQPSNPFSRSDAVAQSDADLRSPTSDFPADSGFRLLASVLFGCGSAALCLFVAILPLHLI